MGASEDAIAPHGPPHRIDATQAPIMEKDLTKAGGIPVRWRWSCALIFLILVGEIVVSNASADELEKAYALNQEAQVDLATAQFRAAAEKFLEAASLVSDYEIRGRSLEYTPSFHAAWTFEKINNIEQACRYFKQFLKLAPAEHRDPTKVTHAQEYLSRHCEKAR